MNSSITSFINPMSSPKNEHRKTQFKEIIFNNSNAEEDVDRAKTVGHNFNYGDNKQMLYREFVKIYLKIKFEKLDVEHSGQKINQNIVWKEALRLGIPRSQWKEFILDELKNFKKYKDSKKEK